MVLRHLVGQRPQVEEGGLTAVAGLDLAQPEEIVDRPRQVAKIFGGQIQFSGRAGCQVLAQRAQARLDAVQGRAEIMRNLVGHIAHAFDVTADPVEHMVYTSGQQTKLVDAVSGRRPRVHFTGLDALAGIGDRTQAPIVADGEQPRDGAARQRKAEDRETADSQDAAGDEVDRLNVASDEQLVAVGKTVHGCDDLIASRAGLIADETAPERLERRRPGDRAADGLAAPVDENPTGRSAGIRFRPEPGDVGGKVRALAMIARLPGEALHDRQRFGSLGLLGQLALEEGGKLTLCSGGRSLAPQVAVEQQRAPQGRP